jgi:hypothetical protein
MALIHIANTGNLSSRIRQEIDMHFPQQGLEGVDLKKLANNPLLSSIYAETLRLHVKSFIVINAPLNDICISGYKFSRGSIGLVNSDISHMDTNFWNTKNGLYPLQSFWAERFLTDPDDPSSGPKRVASQEEHSPRPNHDGSDAVERHCSMRGLEGSWIPYGGASPYR